MTPSRHHLPCTLQEPPHRKMYPTNAQEPFLPNVQYYFTLLSLRLVLLLDGYNYASPTHPIAAHVDTSSQESQQILQGSLLPHDHPLQVRPP